VGTGIICQLRMVCREKRRVIAKKYRTFLVREKHFDTVADRGDNRRTDEDAEDRRLGEPGDLPRGSRLERIFKAFDLPSVGVPGDCDRHSAEEGLPGSFDTVREEDSPRTCPQNGHATIHALADYAGNSESFGQHADCSAFSAGDDEGPAVGDSIAITYLEGLDTEARAHFNVAGEITLE
jgi:hypothetical protein